MLESAELLLERGADAAAVNSHGLSLLMFASHLPVEKGAAALVRLLLRHGAGAVVNMQVGRAGRRGGRLQGCRGEGSVAHVGTTQPHLFGAAVAACARAPQCSLFPPTPLHAPLLPPRLQDPCGCTALYYAAGRGNAESVAALLEAGADPCLPNVRTA